MTTRQLQNNDEDSKIELGKRISINMIDEGDRVSKKSRKGDEGSEIVSSMENKIKQLEEENKILKSSLEEAVAVGKGTKNEVSNDNDEEYSEEEGEEEEEEDSIDDEMVIKGEETFKLDDTIILSDPCIENQCNESNILVEKWLLPGDKEMKVESVTNFVRKLLLHTKAYMEHRYSMEIRLHDVLLTSRGLGYVVADSDHDPLLQWKDGYHRTSYITPLEIATFKKNSRDQRSDEYRSFHEHGCNAPTHSGILRKGHAALICSEDFGGNDIFEDTPAKSRKITFLRQEESLRRLKFDFKLLCQEKKELFVKPEFELNCSAFSEIIAHIMNNELGVDLSISRSAMNLMQRLVEIEVLL